MREISLHYYTDRNLNRKSDLSDSTETGTVRQNKRTGEGIVSLHGVERSGCSADECLSRDEYGEVGGRE